MRDILFKAKGLDGEGWREGYYWRTQETTYCFEEDYEKDSANTKHYLLFDRMTDWGLPNQKLKMDIDPETLCQYTGVNDLNSRKIWENDIIKYQKKLFVVEWNPSCAHFAAHPVKETTWSPCMNFGTMEHAEVIGNIFDNSELLI